MFQVRPVVEGAPEQVQLAERLIARLRTYLAAGVAASLLMSSTTTCLILVEV